MFGKPFSQKFPVIYDPIPGKKAGVKVVDCYRVERDSHFNAIYKKVGEQNLVEYVNSFKNGCALSAILDRIQLMPVHDKIQYLNQTESGFSADLSAMPTDGTAAQIMLSELYRKYPDLVTAMKNGSTFDQALASIFGKPSEPTETKTETEVTTNG